MEASGPGSRPAPDLAQLAQRAPPVDRDARWNPQSKRSRTRRPRARVTNNRRRLQSILSATRPSSVGHLVSISWASSDLTALCQAQARPRRTAGAPRLSPCRPSRARRRRTPTPSFTLPNAPTSTPSFGRSNRRWIAALPGRAWVIRRLRGCPGRLQPAWVVARAAITSAEVTLLNNIANVTTSRPLQRSARPLQRSPRHLSRNRTWTGTRHLQMTRANLSSLSSS